MFRLSVVQRVGGVLLVLLLSGVAATETEIEQVKPKNGKADELRIEVRGPFTIALPPGWTANDQLKAIGDVSPEDRDFFNIVIFASVNLEELEREQRNIAMLEWDIGDLPGFFVDRSPASRGMSCEGMSKKAEKKIVKAGPALLQVHSETISIGDCQGLRIRGRTKKADGTEWVMDVHALSDGNTLYLFSLRNIAENYDKNLEVYEEAVSTVRLPTLTALQRDYSQGGWK